MLLIKNGRVMDPASGTDATLDVLLDGGRIAQIATNLSAPGAEVFNAAELIVAPGFIDLHCHLRTWLPSTRFPKPSRQERVPQLAEVLRLCAACRIPCP